MLGSITPLGERSRGMSWRVTATAFAAGSALGGAAVGWLAGLAGGVPAAALGRTSALGLLAAAAAVALVVDSGRTRLRRPTLRRQVDERWLRMYRGWVYGAGFGVQLGVGVVTIVSTSAVYLTFLAAALAGGGRAGATVGLGFGLARAWTLVPATRVRGPGDLLWADRMLQRWRAPVHRAAQAATAAVALAAAVLATL
jgi:hypothetical protein